MAGKTKASLTQQLLDISRLVLNSGNCSTLRLTTSSINFTASSNKNETPSVAHKKTKYKSLSHKQRNYTRKQNYLKQNLDVPISEDISEKPVLTTNVMWRCDVSDFTTPSRDDLDTHTFNTHRDIEHLDGEGLMENIGYLDQDGDEIYLCDFCDQRGKKKKIK